MRANHELRQANTERIERMTSREQRLAAPEAGEGVPDAPASGEASKTTTTMIPAESPGMAVAPGDSGSGAARVAGNGVGGLADTAPLPWQTTAAAPPAPAPS